MVCFDSPLEQYLSRNPDVLFALRSVEELDLDPENVTLLALHALCAAAELPLYCPMARGARAPPLGIDDVALFGSNLNEAVKRGHERDWMVGSEVGEGYWQVRAADNRVLYDIDIRSIEQDLVRVLLEPSMQEIDSIAFSEAFFTLYEGAVYLYQVC